jgi:carbon dioxide concentrating mechanism protein CcmO
MAKAAGILEVRGMVALTGAVDAMLKAADVQVCGRHGVGSGWVTVVVEGDVAAVQTAVQLGQLEAKKYGEVIAAEVIARPEARALEAMPHRVAAAPPPISGSRALGMLETQGLVPLIAGADAMAKAADVELGGWAFIGGALLHLVVRGDVAAVRTAVEAGQAAAAAVGEVHSTLVIPQPMEGIGLLLPPPPGSAPAAVGALGVLETTGYVGAVTGSDAMSKAADVEILRLSIGSGGRIAVLVAGGLDDVQAAIAAGSAAVERVGELNSARVVSRPAPEVMACFGGSAAAVERSAAQGEAMGLIETRSTIALVKALDEMLKAADIRYEGSYKVGYFLTASVVRGDVGAVQVALDVGATTAVKYGELVAVDLIPYPFAAMAERLPHV